jgi:hypothetical protein
MSRFLARLLGLAIGVSVVAGTASALAALRFKKKAPPLPDPAADEIDLVAVMEARAFASTAGSFRGGRVICWYAGLDLDLREATFDPAGADLEVRTVFGGTRVVVAPGVRVAVGGPAIFGGRSNAAVGPAAGHEGDDADRARPGITISGFAVFGGLQVITAERGEGIVAWVAKPEPTPESRPAR